MARQFLAPGGAYLNETATRQFLVPGRGYLNETQSSGSVGSAAGTSTVSAGGVTAAVGTGSSAGSSTATGVAPSSSSDGTASGTSTVTGDSASTAASGGSAAGTSSADAIAAQAQHSNVNSYLIPAWGVLNETRPRQYLVPGRGYVNETQTTGYSGTAAGGSVASAVGAAILSSSALSSGAGAAGAVGASLVAAAGSADGEASATGDGSAFLIRPVICITQGDYFSYICLDRRADSPVSGASAFGSSTATGAGAALVGSAGSAAGTSSATGATDGSVVSSSGTATGTSTATGGGTSDSTVSLTIPGTPKVVYSDIRPAGYVGNTFRIYRESDLAELDIGFLPNGRADYASADAFAPLGWRRKTQYDLSGNGLHLTVPGSVSAPKDFGNTINGLRCLTFNGPGTTMAMANTSVTFTDVRNVTVMAIIKTANQGIFELGNPTRKMSMIGALDTGINWSGVQGQYAVTSPQVMLVVGNGAGNRTLKQNDIVTTAAAQSSSAVTGLTIGNAIGYASPGNVDILTFVAYDSTLSSGDQTTLTDSAHAATGIPKNTHDVIAFHGDSILAGNSRGAGASYESIWFNLLRENTTRPFVWYNCGHGGYTAATLASVAPTVAAACYNPLGDFKVVIAAGSNDLAFGASAATAYASIKSMVAAWRSAGATHVNVATPIVRKALFSGGVTAASFETERQALRALILAGVGVDFDSVSDPGGHPILGDPANCNSTNFVDLVHPNVVGNGYMEESMNTGTAAMRA